MISYVPMVPGPRSSPTEQEADSVVLGEEPEVLRGVGAGTLLIQGELQAPEPLLQCGDDVRLAPLQVDPGEVPDDAPTHL